MSVTKPQIDGLLEKTEQNPFLHEGDTLTEAFIKALPDEEQQETCNALNRRTEFRVLRITYGLFDKPAVR